MDRNSASSILMSYGTVESSDRVREQRWGGSPQQEVQPTHTTGTLHPGWLKIDWLELVSQAASFISGEMWVSLAAEKLESVGGVSRVSAAQVTQALVKTFPDPRRCP